MERPLRVSPGAHAGHTLLALAVAALAAACGRGGDGEPRYCTPAYVPPPGLLQGPQVALPSPTGAVVAFATEDPAVGSVEYGPDANYGSVAAGPGPETEHRIALVGLAPGSTVHYRVLVDGVAAGGDRAFRTPPSDPEASVRFAVVGDTGTGCRAARRVAAAVEAAAPDFLLLAGDLAYPRGTGAQVRARLLGPYSFMDRVPLFAALGNHDVVTDDGAPLLDALVLPVNAADGSERFYSFDWGPVHVAVLDSNGDLSPAGVQGTWLDADLAASSATWKALVLHHPPYSSSRHGSDLEIRAALEGPCEAHGVDLVFSGHDHVYERSFPMRDGLPVDPGSEPDYVDPAGTVFVVTGGGGARTYAAGRSAFTAATAARRHYTLVEIEGSALALSALRPDGALLDRMMIAKGP